MGPGGGEWRGLYVFDLQVQADIDYEIGNWYVSTHPGSPFLGQLKVARLAPGKRHTLNNAHYAIHYLDRPSEKRAIAVPRSSWMCWARLRDSLAGSPSACFNP